MIRVFIGLELPAQIRHSLYAVSETLRQHVNGANWVPERNIHLTLKFLGSIHEENLKDIEQAIKISTADFRKFIFSIDKLGCFPNPNRARVIWIGVRYGKSELVALSNAIDQGLAKLGYESEKREFSPHITLARIKVPKSLKGVLDSIPIDEIANKIVNVDKITVFKSTLTPTGAEYEALFNIPLNP